ncbi:MAG: hypothetical protein R6X25_11855 [Candidatus Krumholzibacteriia bacterium]
MTPKSYHSRLLRDLVIVLAVLLALVVLVPRASHAALRIHGRCAVPATVVAPVVSVSVPHRLVVAPSAGFRLRAVARPRILHGKPVKIVARSRVVRPAPAVSVPMSRPVCGHRVWVPGHWTVQGLRQVWIPGRWQWSRA